MSIFESIFSTFSWKKEAPSVVKPTTISAISQELLKIKFPEYNVLVDIGILNGGSGVIVFRNGFKIGGAGYRLQILEMGPGPRMSFGFGGLILAYEINFGKTQLSFDTMLAGGDYSIYYSNAYKKIDDTGVKVTYPANYDIFSEDFFATFPKVNFSFKILWFMHGNLNMGFIYTAAKELNLNAFIVGAGLTFGWWRE